VIKSQLLRKTIMTLSTEKIIAYLFNPLASNHINVDLGYDAEPFSGQNVELFADVNAEPVEVEMPSQPILFQGLLSTVHQTDFPVTMGETYPLVSKRMVEVLESVGSFPHQAMPVRIIDGAIGRRLSDNDDHYDSEGNLKPEYYTDDYVLLHLTTHLDAMDLERSEYDEYDAEMNWVSFVDKFVFKDIGQEYPPIFRLINSPTRLFISEAAKEALEAAGMKSLWLTSHGDTEVENIFWK
jgi:hypothetical protein